MNIANGHYDCKMELHYWGEAPELKGITLLVSVVGVGNAGQLAAEALLSCFSFVKVAFCKHEAVVPCAGNQRGELILNLEIFLWHEKKIAVLLQRAPFISGKRKLFYEDLATFTQEREIEHVVLLGSLPAFRRNDAFLGATVVAFPDLSRGLIPHGLFREMDIEDFVEEDEDTRGHPSGPVREALLSFTERGMPTDCLSIFASEGNNQIDGLELARAVTLVLKLDARFLQVPKDWELIFGGESDSSRSLYI
jgi:hypothetical protein